MTEIDDDKVVWAEEVEQEMGLPPRQEIIKDGLKTVTEYRFNEDDRRVKVVTQYKIVTKKVPKAVAFRKKWKKFGQAAGDPPGPNTANTTIGEEIKVQFIRSRSGELLEIQRIDDDPITKLKSSQSTHACRYCKSPDHWSTQCPYKDMIEEQRAIGNASTDDIAGGTLDTRARQAEEKKQAGVYVPPSMRSGAGAARPGASMMDRRDDFTVRVTNLPEDTTDQDLKDLFSMTGKVLRIYLAKDKQTQRCKGFAFVTYGNTEDAEKAIRTITGHRYDHLILKVEWAKPSTN